MVRLIVWLAIAAMLLAIGGIGYSLRPEPPRQFRLQLTIADSNNITDQLLSDCSLIRGNWDFKANSQGQIAGRLQPGEYAVVLSCVEPQIAPMVGTLVVTKDGAACLSAKAHDTCAPKHDFVYEVKSVDFSPVLPGIAGNTGVFIAWKID